jgi:aspartyl-tRNA(Asn)/glutamyl-tRNA(Gln) amidotransferase subunit A
MLTACEMADAVRAGRVTARSLVADALDRVARRNPAINAFCHVDPDGALSEADGIDALIAGGTDPGPLAGVPFGVKDLEDCAGMPTGMGCVFYTGRPPVDRDMVHVARLRAAGAVPIGKVTTAELGFAGDCHTPAGGTTRNPWNVERTPGGSSGGSAAAVAAGMVPFCTGSDGGGSIRAPAAFTGTVGMKPSHGRVPNASGTSENSAYCVIATSVADVARCLQVMAGPDDGDRMSLPDHGRSYEGDCETLPVAGLRAAWSPDLGFAVVDPEVAGIAEAAAASLLSCAGLRRVDTPVRLTNIMPALMAIYTDRLRTRLVHDGFLPDRFDELADATRDIFTEAGEPDALRLYRHRLEIVRLEQEVARLFGEVDVLLCPTTACTAFRAEGPWPREIGGRDARQTGDAPLTPVANFCWNPSISVPAGITRDGLPVGLLITTRRHSDEVALRLARQYEKANPWPSTAPGYEVG